MLYLANDFIKSICSYWGSNVFAVEWVENWASEVQIFKRRAIKTFMNGRAIIGNSCIVPSVSIVSS